MAENRRMTLKEAKAKLRDVGLTINKQCAGDYRVAFNGLYRDTEPSAYYAADIEDAVFTGLMMAQVKKVHCL